MHMGLLQGNDRMRIVGGFTAMSFDTLKSMGMLHRVHTNRGVKYWVRQSTALTVASSVPPANDDASTPPLLATTPHQRSRSPPGAPNHITCSSEAFRWLQRSVTLIIEHLGVLLSPEWSIHHIVVNTSDLAVSQEDSTSSGSDSKTESTHFLSQ